MEEKKNEQHKAASKDTAKKTALQGGKKPYITGGKNSSTRPEQGPDVPPEERTIGIP